MAALDVSSLTVGLPLMWAGYLRDWDRTLRAANHPDTTRYNYLLAGVQLARYLAEVDGNADAAADPTFVGRAAVEEFQAWMVQTRSGSTALNKHKGLQQFFKWLAEDEEIARSPMERVRQPKTRTKLIPIIRDDDTKRVLDACKGTQFVNLRDEAIVRMLYNTGARLSEVADLRVYHVDMDADTIRYRGKGSKDRRVRFGPRTGRALSRYLRARARHTGFSLPSLWLAERGGRPLSANGVKLMLRRRGAQGGVSGVHAHRWRHNYAHEWKLAGGDTGDLMLLLGWTSEDMPGTTARAPQPNVHSRSSPVSGSVNVSDPDPRIEIQPGVA